MIDESPRCSEDPAGNAPLLAGEGEPAAEPGEGGEAACWAHLVCLECGAMISEGHGQGCTSGPATPGRSGPSR